MTSVAAPLPRPTCRHHFFSSPQAFAAARKDAFARLPAGGSKSPFVELTALLASTAAPTLLAPTHIAALLAVVHAGAGEGLAASVDVQVCRFPLAVYVATP